MLVDKKGENDTLCVASELMRHFNFTPKWLDQDTYGAKLKDGTWQGVIGQLMNNEIDVGKTKGRIYLNVSSGGNCKAISDEMIKIIK
jgi:hypothetical protein